MNRPRSISFVRGAELPTAATILNNDLSFLFLIS